MVDPTAPRKINWRLPHPPAALEGRPDGVNDQSTCRDRLLLVYQQWSRDVQLGMQNLLVHGMRSLLTMLGMIFGVAAVVAMLSIGAGARQKVMALIEQMGVHNLIVEAKETVEWQAHQKIRKMSPGLTLAGLPRHPGRPGRHCRFHSAQANHSFEDHSQGAAGYAQRDGRRIPLTSRLPASMC